MASKSISTYSSRSGRVTSWKKPTNKFELNTVYNDIVVFMYYRSNVKISIKLHDYLTKDMLNFVYYSSMRIATADKYVMFSWLISIPPNSTLATSSVMKIHIISIIADSRYQSERIEKYQYYT